MLAINNREGGKCNRRSRERRLCDIDREGGVASVKKGGIRKKEMEEERIVSDGEERTDDTDGEKEFRLFLLSFRGFLSLFWSVLFKGRIG